MKNVISVRLEKEEIEQLENIKRKKELTVSWQIRQAIKTYLKNEKATN